MKKPHPAYRWPADAAALGAGLAAAQLISVMAIYIANHQVHQSVTGMQAAGWFAIPTGPALDVLTSAGAALRGALFFTLSSGAGLTLAAWAMVRLWRFFFPNGRGWRWLVITGAAIATTYVNINGWVLFPSLLAAGVILTTGWIIGPLSQPALPAARWGPPLLVLVILSSLWATQLNRGLFTAIRDQLLLSHPTGVKINDFYYRNTMYAAELFKSFNQKTLRTCRLKGITDPGLTARLTALLSARDVLVIHTDSPVDVTIQWTPAPSYPTNHSPPTGQLTLRTRTGQTITTDLDRLTSDPLHWLNQISELGDRYAPFRRLTFLGLLIGFPILIYTAVYGLIRWICALFFRERRAAWTAAAICLALGSALWLSLLSDHRSLIESDKINALLDTGNRRQKVAALRAIEHNQLDIERYPAYRNLLSDATVVERYYLARALALSHSSGAGADLVAMLDDPHPNVVCQVLYALGRRNDPAAIAAIRTFISKSAHWYVQWYGYNALRSLGWRQTPSK